MDLARDSLVYTAHQLITKSFQSVVYCIEGQTSRNIQLFNETIRGCRQPRQFFAFDNKETSVIARSNDTVNGWNVYDPTDEYHRIGLTEANKWRICHVNQTYSLCETYPNLFIVPLNAPDELISKVAQFRSKERLPATVWRHPKNGATISRCAQPRIGLKFLSKGSRSIFDEKLIQKIRDANEESKLRVIDCRPLSNAKANHLRKGGYEDISNYKDCTLKFLGIGNIHVVRESYFKLLSLCHPENIHSKFVF